MKLISLCRIIGNMRLIHRVGISILFGLIFVAIRWFLMPTYRALDPLTYREHWTFSTLDKLRNKYTVHPEERNFPLAFSLLVYTDIDRAVRLLRAIYRPQNYYCLHVDKKASPMYHMVMQEVATMVGPNVFLIPENERIAIRWGEMSTLEADLKCAWHLLKRSDKWRYWINLTGHEFPLRTNWELVVALKAVNGSNLVSGFKDVQDFGRIPHPALTMSGVTWFKGAVHAALRQEFVHFMLTDPRALKLLESLRRWEFIRRYRIVADEQYFATLNNNPQVFPIPGAYTGNKSVTGNHMKLDVDLLNLSIMRYKVWHHAGLSCGTQYWIRLICMLGKGDLERLKNSAQLFANKFIPAVEPEAYNQLEQWIEYKVSFERQYSRLHPSFNRTAYTSLDVTRNHL